MPSSPFGHPHRKGPCYATYYAKKKAHELVGHFGFTSSDQDDLEQSLLVSLMERWPKYEASECTPQEFISWAIGKGVAEQVRERQARNHFEPTDGLSLEDLINDEEELLPASCVQADHAHAIDLSVDIEQVLASLPPDVQKTARLLMTENMSEAARKSGVSRRTIRDRARIIREAFERAGYGDA
ncbi:MAG: sigma-70 family RNA polymerase sigma factor [Planctomycetaceae bacterium]|nr:sigma-70 family RNA polymerase sigma factor [Planctomycetaceae bacterium]